MTTGPEVTSPDRVAIPEVERALAAMTRHRTPIARFLCGRLIRNVSRANLDAILTYLKRNP